MSDSDILIKAVDLKKYYYISKGFFERKKTLKALDEVSFELKKGKTLAIVGESGCGKSTLARVLCGIETLSGGELYYKDQLVLGAKNNYPFLRTKVQMVFQNPYASLNPRKTVRKILEEPLILNTNLNALERDNEISKSLAKVGLRPEHADRYPHEFSGGQRQRIAIARAQILKPEIVVADEPVSALDVSIQAQVLNLMQDLQKDLGLSYIFISHDLSVVEHIADEVMVMYLGKCVEYGDKESIFQNPLHPYTQALLSATPRLYKDPNTRIKLKGELPSPLQEISGCPFHYRCWKAQPICKDKVPDKVNYNKQWARCFFTSKP